MKASVLVGADALELRDWPEPRIGPGELLVQMAGCGLCGSDIAKIVRGPAAPVVLGHEVVGVVLEAGAGVTGFAPGRRVVVEHHVPCAPCHYCRRGSPSMCRTFKRVNLDPGGFAERLRVPAANVAHATFALPDALPDEVASFTEPLACCLRAVKRAAVAPGDAVLVIGLGSIGCLLAQGFRLAGARVVGWDVDATRRALADRHRIEAPETAAAAEALVAAATDGRGADVVALSAGGAAALPWAAARVRDGGALHYFAGGDGAALPLPLDALYTRELTVTATYSSSPAELAEAFALLARGAVSVDGLVTHRLPLARLAEGVALMRAREAVKVYVTP
jgi:L-iditol 2-dehydrogenase